MSHSVSLLPAAAVLIAHGPTGPTLTALSRVSSLVAADCPIIVVAGTEPGLTAAERASERGYAAATDHGPVALARVLSNLEGIVLVVHDDVAVTRHTVAGMVLAHTNTGLTALPGSARHGAEQNPKQAELSCVVGEASKLSQLAADSAFGPGRIAPGDFVVAADTEVSHARACRKRLVDKPDSGDGPLLVAALIVRDESQHLAECLAALAGVVDRIEVADTGSVDNTVDIALEHGANVIEIEWRDDFAWARNQVLDRCRDASFVLWVDADELFRCAHPKRLRQVLRTYERLYPSYRLEIRNLSNGVQTHSFWAKRIVSPLGVNFKGAIHEQARRVDGVELLEVGTDICSIDHLGYADSVLSARGKLERNLRIARESFEHEPTLERAVHYARSLEGASVDPAATLELLTPLLKLAADAPVPVRAMLLALRAKLELEGNDPAGAAATAEQAARLIPADAVAGAVLAEALVRLGEARQALDLSDELAELPSEAPIVVDRVAAHTRAHALFHAALSCDELDRAVVLVAELPAAVDPWPELAEYGGTELVVGLARGAGEGGDVRIMRAVLERPDVSRAQILRTRDALSDGGTTLEDTESIDAALDDLAKIEAAPGLRERFESSGGAADAVVYAQALATGHLDLTLELEAAASHAEGAAIALGIAAEALRRRRQSSHAAADAIAAVELWPGALRAAVIVAQTATQAGQPQIALEMIEAARHEGAAEGVSRARDHELINCAVNAHLGVDDLQSAIVEALVIVEQRGSVDSWAAMLTSASDDTERMTLVLGLALLSDGADFLSAAAASLRPEKTAELCAAFLVSGGINPDAVITGILAATLRDRHDLAEVMVDYTHLLDSEVRANLAVRLRESGASAIAAKLDPCPA